MKKYIILGCTLALAASFSPLSFSQTEAPKAQTTDSQPALKSEVMTAKVNGMVCDFCAQAVTKVFHKQDGVTDVIVDLDKSEIIVTMAAGKSLDDKTIKSLIRKSGYSLVDISRIATS